MYEFITNLDDMSGLESAELRALMEIWRERKGQLQDSGEYQEFIRKMQREWAIETGIVERLYTWDRGVTEVLIEQGIEASLIAHRGGLDRDAAEWVFAIIRDQRSVIEGIFAFVKGVQPLSEHYIRALHAELTAHQDHIEAQTPDGRPLRIELLKGEYKKQPNNPLRPDGGMHLYCPPEHVAQEMDNLVTWYRQWEARQAPPEVLAAFLHHRFIQIHPFQDGNRRVARALASVVLLKYDLFPLVIRDAERVPYILALESADRGDIKPLCTLFARNQKESILAALGIEQAVQQARHAEEILLSGLQLLRDHHNLETSRMDRVFDSADQLREMAVQRLETMVQKMNQQLSGLALPGERDYSARCDADDNGSPRRHWFRDQARDMAGRYRYVANFSKYCSWASLTLRSINHFQFVVAFHGLGPVHKGLMAAVSFTLFRVPREDQSGQDPTDLRPASPDFFQFNHAEPRDSIESRFQEWLESSLAIAMAEWRRSIAREVGS
ncbi:MAG: Fic family protein [Magnetococcales bacterium]|nr:Fic family protein [Magnetococcales bacterium]